MKPSVDIVVLNGGKADLVFDWMNAFLAVDPGVECRVHFWENGRNKDALTALKWWWMNTRRWNPLRKKAVVDFTYHVAEKNLGFAAGNNACLKHCHAPYVLFMNDDAFPTTNGWVGRLVFAAREYGYAAVGPVSNFVLGIQQSTLTPFWPVDHRAKFLSGFCVLFNRDRFEAIGRWDERFFSGDEDLDISIRLRRAGETLGVCRDVYVHHLGETTLNFVFGPDSLRYAKTRRMLYEKWGPEVERDLFIWEDLKDRPRAAYYLGEFVHEAYFPPVGGTRARLSSLRQLQAHLTPEAEEVVAGLRELHSCGVDGGSGIREHRWEREGVAFACVGPGPCPAPGECVLCSEEEAQGETEGQEDAGGAEGFGPFRCPGRRVEAHTGDAA